MKASLIGLLTIVFVTTLSYAQQNTKNSTTVKKTKMAMEQEQIINLSKQKWQWMADKNVEELNKLFNEKAVFVHMGGTMNKTHELDIIKAGGIQYKKADIEESSVQILGNTAILLNKIKLTAIVGGNEVINPFVVTEVYTNENKNWTLSSMSFTKLLSQ
ncbi:MAG: nuclear transport factor 2 family protein [Saprospiraceae bacterium]|nr:nuclear transport factor 2 family protein [Saprospiraceae bacterium]MBL0295226.1 nuclear transport factor 2 family protein [Saprospiraceae bacterium]